MALTTCSICMWHEERVGGSCIRSRPINYGRCSERVTQFHGIGFWHGTTNSKFSRLIKSYRSHYGLELRCLNRLPDRIKKSSSKHGTNARRTEVKLFSSFLLFMLLLSLSLSHFPLYLSLRKKVNSNIWH